MSPATPKPPPILIAPVVVLVAAVVSVNVLTPAIVWLPPSTPPSIVPLEMFEPFSVVSPLPLPVNVLVPISISPKLLVILPAPRTPTAVRLLVVTVDPSSVALST